MVLQMDDACKRYAHKRLLETKLAEAEKKVKEANEQLKAHVQELNALKAQEDVLQGGHNGEEDL